MERAELLAALTLDMGFSVQAVLRTDSTPAKGLASRRGAGQVRHIHCPVLWLQQAVARWKIRIEKQAGSTLSADVGTKAVIPAQKVWELPTISRKIMITILILILILILIIVTMFELGSKNQDLTGPENV